MLEAEQNSLLKCRCIFNQFVNESNKYLKDGWDAWKICENKNYNYYGTTHIHWVQIKFLNNSVGHFKSVWLMAESAMVTMLKFILNTFLVEACNHHCSVWLIKQNLSTMDNYDVENQFHQHQTVQCNDESQNEFSSSWHIRLSDKIFK